MALSYKEQLQHPKWQQKRLDILNRDNFTCRHCGEKEKQLHVHHFFYIKDYHVWDYPEYALITLCKNCHESEEQDKYILHNAIQFYSDVCLLVGGDINDIINIYLDVFTMVESDGYEYKEAFKITLLKLINPS